MFRLLFKIGLLVILCVLLVIAVDVGRYVVYPDIAELKDKPPGKTAFMIHRENTWREAGVKKKIKHTWVPISRISPYVIEAVTISEDDKFWLHDGFDFEGMQEAMQKNLKRNRLHAGGSTISQQLAKNLYLSPAKNPLRKLKEAVLTWRIEKTLSKRRILELYLNVAEWGDGVFGIQAAARHYYGKNASDLTAKEAARLAVVLPSPRRLKPDGSSRYVARQADKIHRVMIRRGAVQVKEETTETAEEYESTAIPEMMLPDNTLLHAEPDQTNAP